MTEVRVMGLKISVSSNPVGDSSSFCLQENAPSEMISSVSSRRESGVRESAHTSPLDLSHSSVQIALKCADFMRE